MLFAMVEDRSQPPRIKFPLAKVIFAAFLVPWLKRARLARALFGSWIALFAIGIYWTYKGQYLGTWGQVPWVIIYFIGVTPFAVACHRLLLMNDDSVPEYGFEQWSSREVNFLGKLILVSLASLGTFILSAMAIGAVAFNLFTTPDIPNRRTPWLFEMFRIPAAYFVARLSLIIPATALDQKSDMRWAWQLSHGNGWRLAVVICGLPWLINVLQGLMYPDEPTIVQVILSLVAFYILLVIEIALLSLSYKELRASRTQPSYVPDYS